MTNELIEAMAEGIWAEYGSAALFCELDHARKQEIRGKARAALAAAEAAGYRLVPGWVPVSERLPEQGQYPVLVSHQSGAVRLVFGISPFIEGDWMGYYEPTLQGRFLRGITHWMQLPAAPDHVADASKKEVGRDD